MSTLNVQIVVLAPPSAGITFSSAAPAAGWVGPLAPGTILGQFAVQPMPGWAGTIALSGPDAANFALNSNQQLTVGSTPLNAGTYNMTVTATP